MITPFILYSLFFISYVLFNQAKVSARYWVGCIRYVLRRMINERPQVTGYLLQWKMLHPLTPTTPLSKHKICQSPIVNRLFLILILLTPTFLSAQSPAISHSPAETAISSVPEADPTDGIVLIPPPTAASTGTATTSFPIKLPGGRLGMAPDISIDYNHEHQHGWLGKGWDLSLPAITVETRWGVPRFDATNETETYLLNGEQLAPVAHRGPIRQRSADLRFYQRVEVDFARITRHGNAPNNYWWEINFTDGSTSYYGGLPGEELISSSTLQGVSF